MAALSITTPAAARITSRGCQRGDLVSNVVSLSIKRSGAPPSLNLGKADQMSTRRLDELSYECGFLRGGMKHVEEKLERLRGKHYAVDVLSVLLADMITDLRNTREKASDEARTYAKERWIDRRIDQEKMDAADDMAE